MWLFNRFRELVRDQGLLGALVSTWSWLRWRRRGAQLPEIPLTAADWLSVHETASPRNPDPSVLISLVVPVYDSDPVHLRECVGSVLAQSHQRWELVLVDDASPGAWIGPLLDEVARLDPRIRIIRRSHNGGISQATNTGIEQAAGEFVAFMDHDDLLVRTALEWVSTCTPFADLIYTDEAKIDADGTISDRVLKPAWSPRLLLAYNYISHLSVVRAALLRSAGGLASDASGAQDHDLLIRLSEFPLTVAHVPSVLYLWRRTPDSTADDPSAKPYAEKAGLSAVADAIERREWPAEAQLGRGVPFKYAVRWLPDSASTPTVKAVMPTRDKAELLKRAVVGLLNRTDHVDCHLVIVDNGSEEPETLTYLDSLSGDERVTVVRVDDAFNFSRLCNLGASAGPEAEYLLFLNNDVEVLHRDWLHQMAGWFHDPEVVAVGTELLFHDRETIQHAGVAIGTGHIGWHLSGGLPNEPRLGDPHDSAHEVTGVTAACMLVRTDAFDAVGGFEEIFSTDFQDVDFCLKLVRDLGGVIVYEPMYPLLHHESATRGTLNAGSGYTVTRMRFRWPGITDGTDPYFHPLASQPYLGQHDLCQIPEDLESVLSPRIVSTLGAGDRDDAAVGSDDRVG